MCAIEWSQVIEDALPEERIALLISGTGEERKIQIVFPEKYAPLMEQVRENMRKEGMRFEDSGM